jgi:hypothetical protein
MNRPFHPSPRYPDSLLCPTIALENRYVNFFLFSALLVLGNSQAKIATTRAGKPTPTATPMVTIWSLVMRMSVAVPGLLAVLFPGADAGVVEEGVFEGFAWGPPGIVVVVVIWVLLLPVPSAGGFVVVRVCAVEAEVSVAGKHMIQQKRTPNLTRKANPPGGFDRSHT